MSRTWGHQDGVRGVLGQGERKACGEDLEMGCFSQGAREGIGRGQL